MDKFFNTAGPNKPDIHHTLLPIQRVNGPEISSLIGARKYFMLHAPRNDVNAAMGSFWGRWPARPACTGAMGAVRLDQGTGKNAERQDALRLMLERWACTSPKPLIIFLDEVDAVVGDTLISLLRQIRAGYAQRPEAFPQSMVLCGVRDAGGRV